MYGNATACRQIMTTFGSPLWLHLHQECTALAHWHGVGTQKWQHCQHDVTKNNYLGGSASQLTLCGSLIGPPTWQCNNAACIVWQAFPWLTRMCFLSALHVHLPYARYAISWGTNNSFCLMLLFYSISRNGLITMAIIGGTGVHRCHRRFLQCSWSIQDRLEATNQSSQEKNREITAVLLWWCPSVKHNRRWGTRIPRYRRTCLAVLKACNEWTSLRSDERTFNAL